MFPTSRDAPAQRLIFVDNLRWSAISMVVVIHAAVTYSHFGSWYVYDSDGTSRAARIAFATYQSFQHAVAMGLLFGIAGFFARASIARKGPVGFLRERLFRLGLPLLLYVMLIGPLTDYYVAGHWRHSQGFFAEWWRHVANGAVLDGSGPLWFCLVLLAFSACFAAVWHVLPDRVAEATPRLPGIVDVLGLAVVMAALTFAAGVATPHGGTVLNVDIHDFPQYPLMFAAGIAAQRDGWPFLVPRRAGPAWTLGGLVIAALAWGLIIIEGGALRGQLDAYGGGWHWQAAAMDAWRSFTCLSLTIGLVTLYRDHFNRHGRISRFLTRSAFGVYVFHPPILIATTRILRDWPLDAVAKFAVASIVGVSLTFLLVGTVARRTPGLRAIL